MISPRRRPRISQGLANATTLTDDVDFGPFLTVSGQNDFDFTLYFEELIFSIAPSALLLIFLAIRLQHLFRTPRKVRGGRLQTTKIVGN